MSTPGIGAPALVTGYEHTSRTLSRIEVVDMARGVALIAMTLFHFGYDLEMFAVARPGFAAQPAMVLFARSIATSFLFLVGVSLVLASIPDGIRTTPFLKRLGKIVAAALLITVATYFATPQVFIFFGILHHIALASVLGLAFLPLPWFVSLAGAIGVVAVNHYVASDALNAPWWWWTGLSSYLPRSSDYVPIFPFFAAVLFGIGAAKLAVKTGLAARLSPVQATTPVTRLLRFIGQHSLLYYLLHQPAMIALLFVTLKVTGSL